MDRYRHGLGHHGPRPGDVSELALRAALAFGESMFPIVGKDSYISEIVVLLSKLGVRTGSGIAHSLRIFLPAAQNLIGFRLLIWRWLTVHIVIRCLYLFARRGQIKSCFALCGLICLGFRGK